MKISGLSPTHQINGGIIMTSASAFWNSTLSSTNATYSGAGSNTVTDTTGDAGTIVTSTNTYTSSETSKRCFEITINLYNPSSHNPYVGLGTASAAILPTYLTNDQWAQILEFYWTESQSKLYFDSENSHVFDDSGSWNPSGVTVRSSTMTAGTVYGFFIDFSIKTCYFYFNGVLTDTVNFSALTFDAMYVCANLIQPNNGDTGIPSVTVKNTNLKYPLSGYLPW